MTVNVLEKENVRLATDNRRLRLENAALTLALEEINEATSNGTLWRIHQIVKETFSKLANLVPGSTNDSV